MPSRFTAPYLRNALLAIKGIGPWTVNYTLLRGYGYADCSLEGDVAIRSALGRVLGVGQVRAEPQVIVAAQAEAAKADATKAADLLANLPKFGRKK